MHRLQTHDVHFVVSPTKAAGTGDPADVEFLCDKAVVLGDAINETSC